MKKLVLLNVVCNGSTGKIMYDLASSAEGNDYDVTCIYGRGTSKDGTKFFKFNNRIGTYFHVLLARLGFNGHGSYFATKKIVRYLRKIDPDIIHMHNIHGYWINLKVLFKYLKNEYKGKIVWTLHDCWAFTGHCSHFTMAKCNKWQKTCFKCPILQNYPKEYFDTTTKEYLLKKKMFTNINNLSLVVPSNWLKELVSKSFLKEYKVSVISNGIDLSVFKPTINKEIHEKYSIPNDKKIILGVSNVWNKEKGFNFFLEMANIISEDEIIVLVGLNKKQKKILPKNVIGIEKTENVQELVNIYSIASVFVNPSLEETFSLVTIEAMACGLPVVVSKTSAIKELVSEETGYIVKNESVNNYYKLVENILKTGKDKYLKFLQDTTKKYILDNMLNENLKNYNNL